jgi:hypothetical protein
MTDLSQALAEINAIRAQVARGTQFRGYGPASVAASGLLALAVAAAQSTWQHDSNGDARSFLIIWVATAAVSVALATLETVVRAHRVHSGLAREMLKTALEEFLPALIVGVLLTAVLLLVAPAELWMLPGLWGLIFSLGVFASCRYLPPQMFGVGLWYVVCGLGCLMFESGPKRLSPWEMGIPFGVGQLLVAAVLRYGFEDFIEDR